MSSLLTDVSPFDPITYLGVMAVLVLVTVCASLGPARRAMRVEPVEVLRGQE
jgi:ABC-type lipoprotein release transport system permease subunit